MLFRNGTKWKDYPMDGSRKGDGIAIWMLKTTAKPKEDAQGKPVEAIHVGSVNPHLKEVTGIHGGLADALTIKAAPNSPPPKVNDAELLRELEEKKKARQEKKEEKKEEIEEKIEEILEEKKKCKGWNCNKDGTVLVSMNVILAILIAIFFLITFQIYRMYTSCKVPPPKKKKVVASNDDEPVVEIVAGSDRL